MGKIKKGILGGFVGKVGNVVGTFWKGKAVMKSLPGSVHQPNTQAQLEQRARFGLMSSFISRILTTVNVGFKARENGTTASNEAFSANFASAITGTYPAYAIDYSSIVVSEGNLTNLGSVAATDSGTGDIDITWQDNSGTGTAVANDNVHVLLFNVTKDVAVDLAAGTRGDATYAWTNPTSWGTDTVHVWLFASDADGNCSRSQYAGSVICS